jgi:pilus assembly protein CpaB
VALTLSVAVTYLTYRVLSEGTSAPDEFTNIIVATSDIPMAASLAPEDLRLAPWPVALAVEGHLEEADMARIIGRGTIFPIYANEPVLESKLAPEGSGAGLAPTIPEGMRAMSVRVNEIIGVAGFILPGSRVDVILTGTPQQGGNGQELAKAFLENVTVQSVGQNLQRNANGEPQTVSNVTLLVSVEDMQALALAQDTGSIRLALRNPQDLEVPDPEATEQASLFRQRNGISLTSRPVPPPSAAPVVRAVQPLPAPVAPLPPPSTELNIELIQGANSQSFTFEGDPE